MKANLSDSAMIVTTTGIERELLQGTSVSHTRGDGRAFTANTFVSGDAELSKEYRFIEDLARVDPSRGLIHADCCLTSRAIALLGRHFPQLSAGNRPAGIALAWLNPTVAETQSTADSALCYEDRLSLSASDTENFFALLRAHETGTLLIQYWESAEFSAAPIPTVAFPNVRFHRLLFPPGPLHGSQNAGTSAEQSLLIVRRIASERWLLLSAVVLGIAQAVFDYVFTYSQKRIAFGKAICHHQAVALKLADTATNLVSARLLGCDAWSSCEPLEDRFMHVQKVWEYAQETAQESALTAIQIMGGHGYLQLHPVQQWLCDIRFLRSYGELPGALVEQS